MAQDFGNSARLGAELAVKEMNEVGGYPGRPVELVVRDDKANRDEGRKVSEDLVLKEKVAFTIGFCNTGVATHDKPFSANDHDAFTRNMIWLGVWRKGKIQFEYPEDAKRASMIRRKQAP